MKKFKQVLLVIFDGWGIAPKSPANAIELADKPYFDYLWDSYPHSKFNASGLSVGLPEGESGNSDVGHVTIGAGKAIDTNLVRINKAVEENSLEKNETLQKLFDHVKKNNSALHFHGFLSDGGVHSRIEHLFAMIRYAKNAGIQDIVIHVFTDGRDTPPQSAAKYLLQLEDLLDELGVGFIATASGRFYADRDNNWERVKVVEDALFAGDAKTKVQAKPSEYIKKLYDEGIVKNDQLLEPIIFLDEGGKSYQISENDAVVYFNYRADRARMISQKHSEYAKDRNILFATMTEYASEIDSLVLFPPLKHEVTLASVVANSGLSQSHIAETEKYTHLTFFLDGGIEAPLKNEEYILIKSRDDVKTHDEAPEMKALEIADAAIKELDKGINLVIINFANPDMIGHTGNLQATVKAIEVVDKQLKRVVEKVLEMGGVAFITSDHGNAEQMLEDDELQSIHTYHTSNLIPAILTDTSYKLVEGGLADVAPTVIELLGLEKPKEMTGHSLLAKK